ncbi:related to tRNA (guanine-N(1)-)-methyltransferase [Cephalotrichum gorgonifer]|uniref:tRNA (guanine(9)-N1)-methyltransferase n=1 Tax=Cephalotrichum gorgonifer TaxID=2041049 RepID=A0AAE8N4I9_9PEZI|nr:related to tRNA (guanine-N(1)-)-methyltransferase [Cephalotrichum gorgonifer]
MEDPTPEKPNGAQEPTEAVPVATLAEQGLLPLPAIPASAPHQPPTTQTETVETRETTDATEAIANNTPNPNPLSRNQQKKLRKRLAWEATRTERLARRKEKRIEIRHRKRDQHAAAVAEAKAAGIDPRTVRLRPERPQGTNVPVSIIIDCSFEHLMVDKEIKSLSSQIMRSYSETRNSQYRPHLVVGSWGGKLKERFDVGMNATHRYWKGIHFVPGDLGDSIEFARKGLAGPNKGEVIPLLGKEYDQPAIRREESGGIPVPEPEEAGVTHRDIVYLSSESPYLLDRLEPGTTYVVGGLVDKNREKGLCYRLARERGVRTAKLPIAEYMVMHSRQVLATNHVVEIMVRWLQCGDWGEAFLKAIPKRKEARLKGDGTSAAGSAEPEGTDDGEDSDDDAEEREGSEEAGPVEVTMGEGEEDP